MIRRFSLLTIFLTIGFLAGLVLTGRMRSADESSATPAQPPGARPTAPVAVTGGLPDLTAVAQRSVSSVTNISSSQPVRSQRSPFANDPFFRYFFGDDDPFGYRERRALSLGSGVVVSSDGYLLTNNH